MANPLNSLLQPQTNAPQMSGQASGIAAFKQMAGMLSTAKDPQSALSMLAQQNPQIQQVMQMCQGKNPRDVFVQACKSRGINPDQLIQQLGLH